jgi:hypothetical protein
MSVSGVTSILGLLNGATALLNLGVNSLTVDLTATRSAGFRAGSYSAEVIVRCS